MNAFSIPATKRVGTSADTARRSAYATPVHTLRPRYNDCLQDIDSRLRRAGHWFLRSGIQQANGGVARYYRSDLGKNARVSTEITGYAVSTLLFLGERTGDGNYTDAAMRAARFLTDIAWSDSLGTFPFEHSDNCEQPRPLAYFFDCGIIIRGLLQAWRVSGEKKFLDRAVEARRSMGDFWSETGIHPILQLPEKEPLRYEPKWSASPGCYQLKAAMAWDDLSEEFDDAPEWADHYECVLEQAMKSESSFLPGEADREKVMDRLHAYCYYLEGLLPRATIPKVGRALTAGIDKAASYLRDIAPQFARSDVYAQLLRVRMYAAYGGAMRPETLEEGPAAEEAEKVAEFQLTSDDPRVDGGFAFGRKGSDMMPFVNPVSTGFCAQALAMWHDRQNGTLNPCRQALI
jgi:hypothetical protein